MNIEIIIKFEGRKASTDFISQVLKLAADSDLVNWESNEQKVGFIKFISSVKDNVVKTSDNFLNLSYSYEPQEDDYVITGININNIYDLQRVGVFVDRLEASNSIKASIRGTIVLSNDEKGYFFYKGERFLGNNKLANQFKWSLSWIGIYPIVKLSSVGITENNLQELPIYRYKILDSGSIYLRLVDSYDPNNLSDEYIKNVELLEQFLRQNKK